MKRAFALFVLACCSAACQHSAPATQVIATRSAAAAKPAALQAAPPTLTAITPDSLTPAMQAALRQVDVSSLFLAPENLQSDDYKSVLDGFFGSKPQRLSLAILQATRDSLNPAVLHIVGKMRYQKQVTAFTGDLRFTRLADYYDQGLLAAQGGDEPFVQDTTAQAQGAITNAKAYSATATFRFTGKAPAAYVLAGQALLDFWITDNAKVGTIQTPAEGLVLQDAPTKGSGLLLQGTWQEPAGKVARPFLVSRDIFLLSRDLIGDFGVGDRGAEVNPKYAKMGWNTYWENDEWWAESPKPSLNL